jgi:DNA-binding NtrC family response regulator
MFSDRPVKILLIEDEEYDVRRVKNTLKPFSNTLLLRKIVSSGEAAVEALEKGSPDFDVVIMDFQIAGGLSGERLIKRMKQIDPSIQIIVITKMTINISDFEFANRLLEAGAMWYCTKYPGDIEEYIYQPTDFILSLFNAAEKRFLEKERERSKDKLFQNVQNILQGREIIGNSSSIRKLQEEIQKAAQTDATVLIHGSSGTGKELVATHIHYYSRRKLENFIPINCGSLPQELIESELFGFEKGSFTGAQSKKPGLLELAHHGSVFLDEIGELPPSAQSKLLRFIQEGEIDKIGRTEKLKVNVRIIAATNKNITEEVQAKRFREDLFYRLNVFSIWVPPLKDHREDVTLLINYFLQKFCREMGREVPRIEDSARQLLENYDWPGNVRELQNVVQRLLLRNETEIGDLEVTDALGYHGRSGAGGWSEAELWQPDEILSLKEMENQFRKKYFHFVRNHSASDAEAARKLGLAPPNYHRMCKELGLK